MSDTADAARQLAARRARAARTCVECGRAFEAVPRARYCSNTCTQRARRRALAEASSGQVAARKRERRAVPLVGRIAI